jgi:hypothetical protein
MAYYDFQGNWKLPNDDYGDPVQATYIWGTGGFPGGYFLTDTRVQYQEDYIELRHLSNPSVVLDSVWRPSSTHGYSQQNSLGQVVCSFYERYVDNSSQYKVTVFSLDGETLVTNDVFTTTDSYARDPIIAIDGSCVGYFQRGNGSQNIPSLIHLWDMDGNALPTISYSHPGHSLDDYKIFTQDRILGQDATAEYYPYNSLITGFHLIDGSGTLLDYVELPTDQRLWTNNSHNAGDGIVYETYLQDQDYSVGVSPVVYINLVGYSGSELTFRFPMEGITLDPGPTWNPDEVPSVGHGSYAQTLIAAYGNTAAFTYFGGNNLTPAPLYWMNLTTGELQHDNGAHVGGIDNFSDFFFAGREWIYGNSYNDTGVWETSYEQVSAWKLLENWPTGHGPIPPCKQTEQILAENLWGYFFGLLGPIAADKSVLIQSLNDIQILLIDSSSGTATQVASLPDVDGRIWADSFRSAYANGVVAILAGTNPQQ